MGIFQTEKRKRINEVEGENITRRGLRKNL